MVCWCSHYFNKLEKLLRIQALCNCSVAHWSIVYISQCPLHLTLLIGLPNPWAGRIHMCIRGICIFRASSFDMVPDMNVFRSRCHQYMSRLLLLNVAKGVIRCSVVLRDKLRTTSSTKVGISSVTRSWPLLARYASVSYSSTRCKVKVWARKRMIRLRLGVFFRMRCTYFRRI